MKSKLVIGLTTCQSKESAITLIQSLLGKQLIACGQIEGPIKSIYLWEGKLTQETEWRVVLKFNKINCDELTTAIRVEHSYEIPQWVYWEIESSNEYSKWVNNPNA